MHRFDFLVAIFFEKTLLFCLYEVEVARKIGVLLRSVHIGVYFEIESIVGMFLSGSFSYFDSQLFLGRWLLVG